MDRYTPCAGYIGSGDYLGDTELHPEGDYVLYEEAMAEIERLNTELDHYKRLATQRAARMQLLWNELHLGEGDPSFIALASEWFDADGVPVTKE